MRSLKMTHSVERLPLSIHFFQGSSVLHSEGYHLYEIRMNNEMGHELRDLSPNALKSEFSIQLFGLKLIIPPLL